MALRLSVGSGCPNPVLTQSQEMIPVHPHSPDHLPGACTGPVGLARLEISVCPGWGDGETAQGLGGVFVLLEQCLVRCTQLGSARPCRAAGVRACHKY